MCNCRESLVKFTELHALISVGNKKSAGPLGYCSVELTDVARGDKTWILLGDVIYVLDLMYNVISFSQVRRNCFANNADSNLDGSRESIINLTHKLSREIRMLGFETKDGLFEAILSASYGKACVAVDRRFNDRHSQMMHCIKAVM